LTWNFSSPKNSRHLWYLLNCPSHQIVKDRFRRPGDSRLRLAETPILASASRPWQAGVCESLSSDNQTALGDRRLLSFKLPGGLEISRSHPASGPLERR